MMRLYMYLLLSRSLIISYWHLKVVSGYDIMIPGVIKGRLFVFVPFASLSYIYIPSSYHVCMYVCMYIGQDDPDSQALLSYISTYHSFSTGPHSYLQNAGHDHDSPGWNFMEIV
jgi:hypothetical protein